MTVLMMLQDGPLDGEKQIVQDLPNTPGATMIFSLPNYQHFEADGSTVVSLGLQVIYGFVQQGPPPDLDNNDTWDTSWVFGYLGEAFAPVPPPLPEPGPQPPVEALQVWMSAESFWVPDSLPIDTSPGVALVGETAMVVDGENQPTQWGEVDMTAESVLAVTPANFDTTITLTGETSLQVNPT